jgi:hypothetical protein
MPSDIPIREILGSPLSLNGKSSGSRRVGDAAFRRAPASPLSEAVHSAIRSKTARMDFSKWEAEQAQGAHFTQLRLQNDH